MRDEAGTQSCINAGLAASRRVQVIKTSIVGALAGVAVCALALGTDASAQTRRGRRAQPARQASKRTPPTAPDPASFNARPAIVEPVRTLRGRMLGAVVETRMVDDRPSFEYRIEGVSVRNGKLELRGTLQPALRFAGRVEPSAVGATLVSTLAKFRRPDDPAGLSTVGLSAALPSRYAAQTAASQTTSSGTTAQGSGAQAAGQGGTQVSQGTTTAQLAAGQPVTQQQGGAPSNPETAARDSQLSQATQSAAGTPTGTPTAPGGRQPAQGGAGVTATITEAPVQTRALAGAQAGTTTGCEIMYLRMNIPAQLVALYETGTMPVQLAVVVASLDNKQGAAINERLCRVARLMEDRRPAAERDAELAALNELLRSEAQGARPNGMSGSR